jgi:hypothetical protein
VNLLSIVTINGKIIIIFTSIVLNDDQVETETCKPIRMMWDDTEGFSMQIAVGELYLGGVL